MPAQVQASQVNSSHRGPEAGAKDAVTPVQILGVEGQLLESCQDSRELAGFRGVLLRCMHLLCVHMTSQELDDAQDQRNAAYKWQDIECQTVRL